MLGGEVDVGIGAGEPHRQPFLAIAAILPGHNPVGNLIGHIMTKPAAALGKDIGSIGTDLLSQLTQRCLDRSFADIAAALWHLPLRQPRRHPNAVANENQAVVVEQHDPNPRAVLPQAPASALSSPPVLSR